MAIIFITGCSTGIGFATARFLAQNGHRVYASMRNPQKSPRLQQEAEKERLPLEVLVTDVDSDDSVREAIQSVIKKEGHIDVLINNAGIGVGGPVEDSPIELFRAAMETNYFGTLRCIRNVLPSMREKRSGTIINIASIAGKIYSHFHGAYAATKAAVEAVSESLAQEVAPFNIRVAVVEPGVIETPIFLKRKEAPAEGHYPNLKRLSAFFEASLENHVQPEVVASVIKDIIDGKSTKFRNPAGPDAAPMIEWRNNLADEEWISIQSTDEENWIKGQEEFLHLNVRKYLS